MGKLNKNELLEGVRNIIQESFNRDTENFDGTTKFNIHRYVNGLIEEGHKNPELMSYLVNYNNALANGAQDFMLFEQFGQGLAKYAKGNKSIKTVIEQMNNTLATDGANLVGYQLIEQIENPLTKDNIKYLYNQYVANKCQETKDNLVEALSQLVEDGDPVATKLNILLTEESSMSANFIHADYVNESEVKNFEKKLQEQRDKKTMDQIFSKVQRYIDEKLDEDEKARLTEKDDFCLNAIANNQGINLSEHINNIRHSDASSNQRLMEVINLYSNAINQGAYEERLYETFLQNVSKFNYLLPVSKAMKSITEKVDSKREEITLTKILEEMKDDHSSFIYVDLIQEDVARYVKEPNAINRVQLRNALMPYASDPYINEMFNVIYSDNSRRANELTEKALNIKDQINIIRENASVSNIYTPVQYVKENEAIFNVNGQFYVKKGNNIAVLEDKLVDQLDERFVELCRLVNDPHVEINEDHIILHSNDKYATIFEGYVDIYGHKESKETLRNLREMCMKYDDYDTNFYIMCSCLLENFNNIAKIDWAKHVTLNENNNINADLFKLDQNIFIATHNDAIGQHTFYRNVNPIFCKNKLNEHMGINVSSLFSDLLPSQDKIILKLNETKNQYEDSIEKYEDMIEKLNKALESASDENKEKLEKAIADAEEKLDDIKAEYKEWQKQADDVTGEDNSDDTDDDETTDDDSTDDDTVTKENPNEPMSDEEVDASKDELSQPLSGEDGDSEATDNFDDEESDEGVTDDEFAKFLGSDSDDDSDDDEDSEGTGFDDAAANAIDADDDADDDETDFDDSDDDYDSEDVFGSDEDSDEDDEEAFKEVNFDDDSDDSESTDNDEDIFEPEDSDETETDDEDEFGNYDDDEETASEDNDEDTYNSMTTVDMGDNSDDEETAEPGDEATDVFGGDTEDPLGTNSEIEDIPANTPKTVEDEKEETYQPKFSYKIADVMFDENVKDGKKEKSGSVIVIVPMIDGTGKKYVENKTIEFYLDDDNNPILDNEPMTNELYAAVIDAIKNHPDYSDVCETAEPANEEVGPTVAAQLADDDDDDDWEAAYLRDGNDEDREEYSQKLDSDDDDDDWDFPLTKLSDEDDDDNSDNDSDDDMFGFKMSDITDDEEDNDDDSDEDDNDSDDKETVIIPTYKSGNTEIELPAPSADGTEIPESKEVKAKKPLKEHKSIKITPVFKNKAGKSFFLNEATIKASKSKDQKGTPLTEEIIDGSTTNEISTSDSTGNNPIEDYNEETDYDTLSKMQVKAIKSAEKANEDGNNVIVTDLATEGHNSDTVKYFIISDNYESGDSESYAIYQIGADIYYRDAKEFYQIIEDFKDEVPGQTIESLKVDYADKGEQLTSYNITDSDDCMFIISSIFSALTGKSYDSNNKYINENCKIKRSTKVDSDNDIDNSKVANDAKYGTKEENDFKQEIEDKQKKDGLVGALDPQQDENEAVKPKLPNVNLVTEHNKNPFLEEGAVIEYEVNDKVLYKNEPWTVFAVDEETGDKQNLKITKNGKTIDVTSKDIKPDPSQFKDIDNTPDQFEFDKNNLNKTPENPKAEKMADLNGKTVECNIVVDSMVLKNTLNGERFKANLKDILEGVDDVRVYVGDKEETWHKDNIDIDVEDWIPAVIASENDEPLRKIKVNPKSYVDTTDDTDLVDCTVAGKVTQLPKHAIRILV